MLKREEEHNLYLKNGSHNFFYSMTKISGKSIRADPKNKIYHRRTERQTEKHIH